jgi:hypothetical protein
MRVTREALMKVVHHTVARRVREDRGIVSIYLSGSLLGDDYLLGGAADIDLTLIHSDQPASPREIISLTDEVHLDLSHHLHRDYRQPRRLRVHPWLGPVIYSCQVLHDPQHFMNFTQASVRGQFHNPEHVYARAHSAADHGRQLWQSLSDAGPDPGPEDIAQYLKAIEHGVVAITSLSGPPLAERRFLIDFPGYAAAVDRPGLAPGLLGLLGAPFVDPTQLRAWLEDWQAAFLALPAEGAPDRLHPKRLGYYRKAFEAILDSGSPELVLWPLIRTWTHAIRALNGSHEQKAWSAALQELHLLGEGFEERVQALDAYFDQVEEVLEEWGNKNGAFAI